MSCARRVAAGLSALCGLAAFAPAPARAAFELPGANLVREKLEQTLASALNGSAHIGAVSVRPLDGEVDVSDLDLKPGHGLLTHLSVHHAKARVALGDLLRGRLRLLAVEADGVDVFLRTPPTPSTGKRAEFDVRLLSELERLVVSGGRLHYEDPERSAFVLDIEGIRVDGSLQGKELAGAITCGPAQFSGKGLPEQRIDRAVLRWSWRAPRLQFDLDSAVGPAGALTGAGMVGVSGPGVVVRGRLAGEVELGEALRGLNPALAGRVTVDAEFRAASPGSAEIHGVATGKGLVTVDAFPWVRSTTRFRYSPDGLSLTDTRAESPGGTHVEALVYRRDRTGAWTLEADGDADVQELLQQIKAGRRASQIRGRARFKAEVAQAAGALESHWTVRAGVASAGAASGAVNGTVDAEGDGVGPGRVVFRGDLDGSRVDLTLRWAAKGFAGDWSALAHLAADAGEPSRAARRDIARYLDDEGVSLPRGVLPPIVGDVAIDLELVGRGSEIVRGDIPFRIERPAYGATPMALLEGRVQMGAAKDWRVDYRMADHAGEGLTGGVSGAPGLAPWIYADAQRLPLEVAREYFVAAFQQPCPELTGWLDGDVRGRYTSLGSELFVFADARGGVGAVPSAALSFDADVQNRDVAVHSAMLRAEGAEAGFDGLVVLPDLLPLEASGALALQLDLQRLPAAAPLAPAAGAVSLAGELRFEGLERPLLFAGELGWRELELAGAPLPDGTADLRPLPDGLDAQLRVEGWDGRAQLTGSIEDPLLSWSLAWSDLEVLGFISAFTRQRAPLDLDIRSTGEIQLAGPFRSPKDWQGAGALTRLDVLGSGVAGRLERPAEVEFAPGGAVRIAQRAPIVMVGPAGGRVEVRGETGWLGDAAGQLGLHVEGEGDLNLFEVLDPDLVASGRITGALELTGPLRAPQITGWARVSDGRLRLLPYPEAVDQLEAELTLAPGSIGVSSCSFSLGGGEVKLFGALSLDGWAPGRFDVSVRARDVALTVPKGVWGRYDADLKVVGPAAEPEVQGDITMLSGRFTRPFGTGGADESGLGRLAPETSRFHWLTRIGLRLKLTAPDSLAVHNDMAQLQTSAAVDITGDLGRVLLAGNVVLLEGGRFTIRQIEWEIISGQVIFDDPRSAPMRVRVHATTDVRGYSIRLDLDAVMGMPLDPQLSSTPALSRSDILELLISGLTPEERAGAGEVTSELTTSFFGSQLGEFLFQKPAQRLLNLDRFQIAPSMVGAEARPTARVTLGKRVDPKTTVLYSRDLSAEGRDVYRVEHDLSRVLRVGLGRGALGGVASDLRWLHRFGAAGFESEGTQSAAPRLARTVINGFPEGVKLHVRRDLGLVAGAQTPRYQVIQAQEAAQRVLVGAGYLEAKIEARLELLPTHAGPASASAVLDVTPGPLWELVFTGPESAVRRARSALTDLWANERFRTDGVREASSVVREALAEDGYATAVVDVRVPDPQRRRVEVSVDPGPRVIVEGLVLEGVKALPEKDVLRQVLLRPSRGLPGNETVYKPRLAQEDGEAIRTLYATRGYLAARVNPRVRFRPDGKAVDLTFEVDEGPRAKVGAVRVEGDWPEDLGPATAKLTLHTGETFTPKGLDDAVAALRKTLDESGRFEARVVGRPEMSGDTVDISFRIWAGRAAVVDSVQFEGLVKTRRKTVADAVRLKPGAPLSERAVRETESELFRLGVFRKVEVKSAPVGDDPVRRAVTIVVEENPSVTILTSLGYDTVERVRSTVTLSDDDLWGLARTGSLQAYASAIQRGVRATLEDRHLNRDQLQGLLTVGVGSEDYSGFTLQTTSAALQIGSPPRQERRLQVRYVIEDNRFSRVTLDPDAIAGVLRQAGQRLESIRLGGLQASAILDRRDDPFVPMQGWQARADVGLWARVFASQASFGSVTGQIAGYQPRGRLTLAGSLRFGLAWPAGQTTTVPLSQRYFAGGADSLRGFPRDGVGPLDNVGGYPLGGEALLVTNLEARYRLWGAPRSGLQLTLFYDVGNVWLKAAEFYQGNLRKAVGLGFRYDTPVGALRVEYGWKLDRQEGETPGEIFLSIGEPF